MLHKFHSQFHPWDLVFAPRSDFWHSAKYDTGWTNDKKKDVILNIEDKKWFTVFYCIAMSWCRKELGLLVILMLPLPFFFAFSNAQCGEIFFKRVLIIPIPLYFNKLHFRQESLKKPFGENIGM